MNMNYERLGKSLTKHKKIDSGRIRGEEEGRGQGS